MIRPLEHIGAGMVIGIFAGIILASLPGQKPIGPRKPWSFPGPKINSGKIYQLYNGRTPTGIWLVEILADRKCKLRVRWESGKKGGAVFFASAPRTFWNALVSPGITRREEKPGFKVWAKVLPVGTVNPDIAEGQEIYLGR